MGKRGPKPGTGGRPRIPIDWKEFSKLCELQCTEEEIASWFDLSIETLNQAVKRKYNKTFMEIFAKKRGKGKIALRRKQMQVAMKGDRTLLVWLGKNYLNQADKQEISGPGGGPINRRTLY